MGFFVCFESGVRASLGRWICGIFWFVLKVGKEHRRARDLWDLGF